MYNLRWMDLSEGSRELLSDMAGIVRSLDQENTLVDLEPIDVAKGLVSIHDRLPPWGGAHTGTFRQRQTGPPVVQTSQRPQPPDLR